MAVTIRFRVPVQSFETLSRTSKGGYFDLDKVVSEAIRLYRVPSQQPLPFPPATTGEMSVTLSPPDEAGLRQIAKELGMTAEEAMPFVIADAIARRSVGLDGLPRAVVDHSSPLPKLISERIVLHLGLSEFSPEDEVAEHVAGLIDAMSRWQVATGGNPLEIDKTMPMTVTGSVVPHG